MSESDQIKCNGCGEYWPCSVAKQPGQYTGIEHAKHHPATPVLTFTFLEIVELLGGQEPEFDQDGYGQVYDAAYKAAREQGASEEEAEVLAQTAETDAIDADATPFYNNFKSAVMHVFEKTLSAHHCELRTLDAKSETFLVLPKESWTQVARELIRTINGEGYFRYDSLEDFIGMKPSPDAFDAVKNHTHYFAIWFDVCEGSKAWGHVQSMWRRR